MDIAVLAEKGVKLKEGEKRDKYLYNVRELTKQWIMKVTVTPVVLGALRTIIMLLVKGLEDLAIRG